MVQAHQKKRTKKGELIDNESTLPIFRLNAITFDLSQSDNIKRLLLGIIILLDFNVGLKKLNILKTPVTRLWLLNRLFLNERLRSK